MPGRNHCQSVVCKGFAWTKDCKSPAGKRTQIGGAGGVASTGVPRPLIEVEIPLAA
jgi:hypothetical protein